MSPAGFPDFRFDSTQPRFPDNYLIDGKQLGAETARGLLLLLLLAERTRRLIRARQNSRAPRAAGLESGGWEWERISQHGSPMLLPLAAGGKRDVYRMYSFPAKHGTRGLFY